mgnify:CR=1 FL=1
MPFGNICGSGVLRNFQAEFARQKVLAAELAGQRMDFHVSALGGGCLEVRLAKVVEKHVCEVPLRTLGPDEEALCIINNFIKRLSPETQKSLRVLMQGCID